jgi:hypothetical protein
MRLENVWMASKYKTDFPFFRILCGKNSQNYQVLFQHNTVTILEVVISFCIRWEIWVQAWGKWGGVTPLPLPLLQLAYEMYSEDIYSMYDIVYS